MTAEELLKSGQVLESLQALKKQVQDKPDSSELRVFLFQMFCVIGDWERANKQLAVLREFSPANLPMAQAYEVAIQCEQFRESVFKGERGPPVLGDPPHWIAQLLQATELSAAGKYEQATAARDNAFEDAPTISGNINGEPFEWLADGDSRLGPVFEVVMNGQYYWVPFSRVRQLTIEPPSDLRDMIWLPGTFTWDNEGTASAMIPTRYVGSAQHASGPIQLARATQWEEPAEGFYQGVGQRIFTTDQGDFSLLDTRTINFDALDS